MNRGTHLHQSNGQHENRWKWALGGFIAIAACFLWVEHRAHLFGRAALSAGSGLPFDARLPPCRAVSIGNTGASPVRRESNHERPHDAGQLLEMMFGWKVNPHPGPFHLASNLIVFGGFILLSSAWQVLYKAQRSHFVATTGRYA
jgi:hypothetical protein